MTKQQLAAKIWESANKMRSKIEANEYKDFILGFIFYKFLSETEVKFLKANDYTDDYLPDVNESDAETVTFVKNGIGYFIAYENLFSTWISKGADFGVDKVRDALSAFARNINSTHKKVFNGIFDTLQSGLSKLGETAAKQTKAVQDLIHLINDIPMDGKQDYDVLGFIYEYLIGMFAANAGKKAGEFYTPHEVSLLMSEIVANHLKERTNIEIYDSASGSGSLLITIGKSAAKYIGGENSIKYYAQELKENTYNLTRMNLVMRGILPNNIVTRNGDTLEDDWPYFDESDPAHTYNPLFVDAVVSNPPYSQAWKPADKENDPRFNGYGLAPAGKSDFAFLLHDLYHLKPDGIMTIVLPHGVLFRGGEEETIRRALIEKNNIDAVIGLPANIFFGTGIPTIIMVLKKSRATTDVLIVDASKGFVKEGKDNRLRARDIKKIVDAVTARESVPKFSRVVSRDEIAANGYNLNIPRYVDSSEGAETWDIRSLMYGGIPESEADALAAYWEAFPSLRGELFESAAPGYLTMKCADIKDALERNADVRAFRARFKKAFDGFDAYLAREVVDKCETLAIAGCEAALANEIFARLSGIPLVDKYAAYQVLDDVWVGVETDLEVIRKKGLAAARDADPDDSIIPGDMVRGMFFSDDAADIDSDRASLASLEDNIDAIFDSLSEEERDGPWATEDGFDKKEVLKAVTSLFVPSKIQAILRPVRTLINKQKALNKTIKEKTKTLSRKVLAKYAALTDDEIRELLKKKWTEPLVQKLLAMSGDEVGALETKLAALRARYSTTLRDTERGIREAEDTLRAMIADIGGAAGDTEGLAELSRLLGGGL